MGIKIVQTKDIDTISEMREHFVMTDGQSVEMFCQELSHRVPTDSVFMLQALKGDELYGFLIAQAVPGSTIVYILQAWNKGPMAVADEFFSRVVVWALANGKSLLRAMTSRNPDAFYRRFSFESVATIVEYEIDQNILKDLARVTKESIKNGQQLP